VDSLILYLSLLSQRDVVYNDGVAEARFPGLGSMAEDEAFCGFEEINRQAPHL
jgi:hypothetical protein